MARTSTKNASTVNFAETPHAKMNGKTPHAAQAESVTPDDAPFDFRSFMKMAGVDLPSWQRVVCSAIASFAAGYLIGSVASVIIDILVVGTALVTSSMFLTWCVYVIGMVIAFYAAFAAGRAVAQYVLSGSVDQDFAAAKRKITGFFGSLRSKSEPIVAA